MLIVLEIILLTCSFFMGFCTNRIREINVHIRVLDKISSRLHSLGDGDFTESYTERQRAKLEGALWAINQL